MRFLFDFVALLGDDSSLYKCGLLLVLGKNCDLRGLFKLGGGGSR